MPNNSIDDVWKAAQSAPISGDSATLEQLLRRHEKLLREQQPPSYGPGGLAPDYSKGNARSIITRNHHFDSWAQFKAHLNECRRPDSPIPKFVAAVEISI
jgi:hypothetical protein